MLMKVLNYNVDSCSMVSPPVNPEQLNSINRWPVEIEGLPTNNLDTEHDFSVFSRLAEVAKSIEIESLQQRR